MKRNLLKSFIVAVSLVLGFSGAQADVTTTEEQIDGRNYSVRTFDFLSWTTGDPTLVTSGEKYCTVEDRDVEMVTSPAEFDGYIGLFGIGNGGGNGWWLRQDGEGKSYLYSYGAGRPGALANLAEGTIVEIIGSGVTFADATDGAGAAAYTENTVEGGIGATIITTGDLGFSGGKNAQITSIVIKTPEQINLDPVSIYERGTTTAWSDADVAEWTEESFTFAPEATGNYCFLLQVSAGISGTGYVMIDDFALAEYVPLAVPGAPAGLRTGTTYTGELILNWTHPSTDIDGNPLNAALTVTASIYDQDGLLGTVEGAPGSLGSYIHTYAADDFKGQKIIRVVASIEGLEGGAATAVATITSLSDGYLKEQAFASDFTSADGWEIIDANQDGATWTNDAEASTMSTTGYDEWLISPAVALEEGMTYYVACELSTDLENGADIAFYRGSEATAAGMSTLMAAYSGLQLSSRATLEIGETFVADEPVQHFGIYVDAENKGLATVAGLKVYRIFGSSEPEAVPYAQDFEDRINVDEYGMPNKWMRNTSSESIFTVSQMPENTIAAHSGEYAAVAGESLVRERIETLSTPLFSFEEGWVYGISFYLYMPGN